MSWVTRIANAFRPEHTAAVLDEELEFHLEQRIAEMVRSGIPHEEAEWRARRKLGNRLNLRESSYQVKSAGWLDAFLRDFRIGVRMLAKHRTATLAAIASLGLAIGGCTGAFALIDALILRPLPVPEPRRLIDLAHVMPAFFSPDNQARESDSFSYVQYQLFRDTARGYADLFCMRLSGGLQPALFDDAGGDSENIRVESISGRGFETLGVKPALGRLIQPGDDSATATHPVAVLSYPFWQRRFGRNPGALGHWVRIGSKQFQIAGVAAPGFGGVQPGYLTSVWLPLGAAVDRRVLADPDHSEFAIWGRLDSGVTASRLHDPLQAAQIHFLRERVRVNPPRNLGNDQIRQITDAPLRVRDASTGRDSLFRKEFRRPLKILALICALLLLVACSNVTNLMIARGSARATEMAVRLSLGATRSRLVGQMLLESVQLAAAAGAVALLFAGLVVPVIVAHLGPAEFPAWLDDGPNSRTLLFAVAVSLLTAIASGVIPAFRASAVAPGPVLKSGSTGHPGRIGLLRSMLAAQVGFSVAVLFLSGLLLLSFRQLIAVNLGFDRKNVVLFDLGPRNSGDHRQDWGARVVESVRSLPGVEAASLSQQRPMGGDMVWIMTPIIRFPGRAIETVRPTEVPVSDGFFQAMRIRWIAGRDFLPQEIAGKSSSVIVNQAFVDKFVPRGDPIGQRFEKLNDDPAPSAQQIVGVVANARYNNLREPEGPAIYSPLRDAVGATLNIRTASPPAPLVHWLRREIETAVPDVTVRGSILLASQIDDTMIGERLLAILAGFFSVVALLLVGVGLYGVVNYAAVRRTREIGIRIALGARRSAVVHLIASGAAAPVIVGSILGIAAGLGLARYLTSQLFGVSPGDFWSLAAPVASMLIATLAAVLPPALRAASADPLIALRYE